MSLSALLLVHVSRFREVSIEYCKTKTMGITLANHKGPGDRQPNEPIKTQSKACSRREAREIVCKRVAVEFWIKLILIG